MTIDTTEIERVVHDIHDFFTEWVGGHCPGDKDTFRKRALDHISDDLVAIFPAGRSFGKADFKGYMTGIYGSNPDFRIAIRDVKIRRVGADMAVLNYEEWQRNAKDSDNPDNGRVTTMVLGKNSDCESIQILQVHETWLPDEVVANGDFDF